MSCGSQKRQAKLGVRMEVARMVLQAAPQDFDTMFPKVLTVVTAGIDLDADDESPRDLKTRAGRNALLNAPIESAGVFGLALAKRLASIGISTVGALVQMSGADFAHHGLLGNRAEMMDVMVADLAACGLRTNMDARAIRDWILGGNE
jgi:hypothetical protein